MKKLHITFIVLVLLIATSCKKSEKALELEKISAGMEHLKLSNKISWLVLLPNLGCKGCIQEGEAFMQQSIKNQEVFFVVTKLESLKMLQQKIGVKIEGLPNVYIDRNNDFNLPTRNAIYPCIVKVVDGKPVDHQFQSPETSQAFELLKTKISL